MRALGRWFGKGIGPSLALLGDTIAALLGLLLLVGCYLSSIIIIIVLIIRDADLMIATIQS